jgi:hypothetical protein
MVSTIQNTVQTGKMKVNGTLYYWKVKIWEGKKIELYDEIMAIIV